MTRSPRLTALLVVLGSLSCARAEKAAKEDSTADLIGKPAPVVTAEAALDGSAARLADLKGKVVLLDFWAVWAPCARGFPHLRGWHKQYDDQGLRVVGLTYYTEVYGFDRVAGVLTKLDPNNALTKVREQEMLRDFAMHHKLEHRLWAVDKDEWNRLRIDYKLRTIPRWVLIDRNGSIRLVRSGASEETAREVESAIKDLLAEK